MASRLFRPLRFLRAARPRILRGLGWALLAVLVAALAAGAWLMLNGWLTYREAIGERSLALRIADVRAREDYVRLEELPQLYPQAVLAVEDRRFYEHGGLDVISLGRALLADLASGSFSQGGSTITQQLAKNLLFSQEKTLVRKAAEVYAAAALEEMLSKDEILELYINMAYYGGGFTGIEAAARGYFGCGAAFLSPAQCTVLAGLPNAPSLYTPLEAPQLALQRQRQVVQALLDTNSVTPAMAQHLLDAGPLALARWLEADAPAA